jgi:hypothetical protein
MTNTLLLEDRIKNSGYKRSYIANKIGMSAYTLAKKINNENEFLASEINGLCDILNIDTKDRMAIFFAQ